MLGVAHADRVPPEFWPRLWAGHQPSTPAGRTHKLTPDQKEATRVLAIGRALVKHGFAHFKNWRILIKLRTDPDRTTRLLRALLVLTNIEINR
ncbi:transposase family protein [Streptomyces erythrochromogenes]|uniref:transposase family protein n=1 Tax=Streptomyces erythrochromogenes TaxID=285574 RepID=UPI0033EC3A64